MHTVAGNPDLADMLPHIRGNGVLDLEYESDGEHTPLHHTHPHYTLITPHTPTPHTPHTPYTKGTFII